MTHPADEPFRIITYETTHQAMAAEEILERAGVPFEVIPTPEEVSAGCGLAHRLDQRDLGAALEALDEAGSAHATVVSSRRGSRLG